MNPITAYFERRKKTEEDRKERLLRYANEILEIVQTSKPALRDAITYLCIYASDKGRDEISLVQLEQWLKKATP